jgi:hypothetical protein
VTLDMLKVSPQVVRLGGDLASRYAMLGARLGQARDVLVEQAADWKALQDVAPRDAGSLGRWSRSTRATRRPSYRASTSPSRRTARRSSRTATARPTSSC